MTMQGQYEKATECAARLQLQQQQIQEMDRFLKHTRDSIIDSVTHSSVPLPSSSDVNTMLPSSTPVVTGVPTSVPAVGRQPMSSLCTKM